MEAMIGACFIIAIRECGRRGTVFDASNVSRIVMNRQCDVEGLARRVEPSQNWVLTSDIKGLASFNKDGHNCIACNGHCVHENFVLIKFVTVGDTLNKIMDFSWTTYFKFAMRNASGVTRSPSSLSPKYGKRLENRLSESLRYTDL